MINRSIVSYPNRGKWGNSRYRGNTSGYLIKDLIEHYQPKTVLDCMAGSYTTKDVCTDLFPDIDCDCFDLKDGFNALTDKLPPKRYDLIFLHPPYWNMIQYSDHPQDLSNAKTLDDYLQKLATVIRRCAEYLSDKGVIVVLIGNLRRKGKYYPLGSYVEVLFQEELREEIIKIQHNVTSMSFTYKNTSTWIPIAHEKVLVLSDFKRLTWRQLVLRVLKTLGNGQSQVSLPQVYDKISRHPKTTTNPTWKATVRRTLQETALHVKRGLWRLPNGEAIQD